MGQTLLFSGLALVGLALFIWKFRFKKNQPSGDDLPYQRQPYLFSKSERAFHRVLQQVNADRAVILGKVCVGDVIRPERSLSPADRQNYFKRISSKRFDFVLCSKNDLSVLCVIDLVNPDRKSETDDVKDKFIRRVCDAAEVSMVHITARSKYDVENIDKIFHRFVPETREEELKKENKEEKKKEMEKDEIYLWTQLQLDSEKKKVNQMQQVQAAG